MRVVAKFAIVFFLTTTVLLTLFSWWNAQRETERIHAIAASDLDAYGQGLREGMLAIDALKGDGPALEWIRAASLRRADVSVHWLPDTEAAGAIAANGVRVSIPVALQADAKGTIVLERSVAAQGDLFRDSLYSELGFAALLGTALCVIAGVLGGALIGAPLERVVRVANRVGAGDLSQTLPEDRKDEIGDLKRAVNAMCSQLSLTRDRLEQEASARIATLEQLRHLDRLRTVGMLASSLAHELGTPLNVLLLRGQSLAAGEALTKDEVVEAGQLIADQVDKMSRLVRRLLDYSRRAPNRKNLKLGESSHRALGLLGGLLRSKKCAAELTIDEEVRVEAESDQLEQAITNLVVNALHAMPEGGTVTLRIGRTEATPSESVGKRVVSFVEVRDSGIGMSEAHLARVFEPFYTTKGAGEGTGLGLSVTQGIAEDHGGWIAAESTPGVGSCFTIYLPLASDPVSEACSEKSSIWEGDRCIES